jgi:hypothetical protein
MAVHRYAFREGPLLGFRNADDADPEVIGEVLSKISDGHLDRLKPQDVVEAARSKRSPIHGQFTWDDKEAGEILRLAEARALIRSIVVVNSANPNADRQRAFISIADGEGRAYRPLKVIQDDPQLQLLLLQQALRDLQAFQKRYRDLADVCTLVAVAERALRGRLGEQQDQPA